MKKSPAKLTADRSRMKVWKHNSFLGNCAMSRAQMQGIILSDTATDEAKNKAFEIQQALIELHTLLLERRPSNPS